MNSETARYTELEGNEPLASIYIPNPENNALWDFVDLYLDTEIPTGVIRTYRHIKLKGRRIADEHIFENVPVRAVLHEEERGFPTRAVDLGAPQPGVVDTFTRHWREGFYRPFSDTTATETLNP